MIIDISESGRVSNKVNNNFVTRTNFATKNALGEGE